jgi:hydroxypyruvate reductase
VNIASGPTVADPTTCDDARAILKRYGIDTGADVLDESIKPGDARLAGVETQLIATPRLSLDAAADIARAYGVTPVILGDDIEGDAAQLGRDMAQDAIKRGRTDKRPFVLLSGGETTVTLRGKGRGGRNVEFLLSMAQALNAAPDIYALAGDTDGVDGTDDIAGAFISPDTLARAAGSGIDAGSALQNNDAHTFFEKLGDSVVTGPTFTNVNDFRAVLVTKG